MECKVSTDWTFRGIETVIFENCDLRIVVLSGKGTDISEIAYKPSDVNLLFRNPWGPLSPKMVPLVSPHDQAFRDYTGGGWSDILPNAGSSCELLGLKFSLHDETPLLSWSYKILEPEGNEVAAKFWTNLRKYPFHVEKILTLKGSNELSIQETVTNQGRQDLPFSWLIHPTFSSVFLEGSTLNAAASRISYFDHSEKSWRYPVFLEVDGSWNDVRPLPSSDTAVHDDTLILSELDRGHYDLTSSELDLKFSLDWDKAVFPYIWYYRSINARDYPYFGRSAFVAIEPCTSAHSGLANQVKSGDSRTLEAGESLTTEFTTTVSSLK
jgi:hypothetical protein